MRLQRQSTGELIVLGEDSLLGTGGEAHIYVVPGHENLVAKVWHKPSPERTRKVAVMLANPPVDPMANQNHSSIAWPIDMLFPPGRARVAAGFLMPRVVNMRPVADYMHPKTRRRVCPLFNYLYLLRTARNLATAVRALHERGYVIGDLNESNVLVSETALVTLVDTDSFQVWDAETGHMYRCRVGKPEFTPPEMQGKTFSTIDRTPANDLFALGVLVFQLLMEGTHPFAGIYRGSGEPPPYEKRIAAGHFPFAGDQRIPYAPKPTAPPFEMLAPGLRNLFLRCFQDGHFRPELRPDPQTWQWLIEEAELHLVVCWQNSQHLFGDHLEKCPWCERAQLLGGRDPFPSIEAVKRGEHLRPMPRRGAAGRSGGQKERLPVAPGVPLPPPIPKSSPGGKRLRQFRGKWNEVAWIAAGVAAVDIAATAAQLRPNALTFLLGIAALLTGILGEANSRKPDIGGRGRWLARSAFVVGLGTTIWCLWAGA